MIKYLTTTDNSCAQFFIRIALAVVIFPHGAQKAFGWFGGPGLQQTIQIFNASGFSPLFTLLLVFFEVVGPVFLILGFMTRIWALGIGTAMTICMLKNHIQHGFFMNWFGQQQGEGFEFHILLLGIALALLFKGGGRMSVDQSLTPKKKFMALEH
ncbi:MAG: DoxX family protein [Proteobacteria bacterium]|nr:DoxX family protein [Pseudomonadota bacterium]MBU1714681.1 DoxX family protein [Pseudomonadota bacterium]